MTIKENCIQFIPQNTRTMTISYRQDNDIMWVQSRMQDDHHDMKLYWQIDVPKHTVIGLEGEMDQKPFEDCSQSLQMVQNMVGLVIGAGVKKNFRTRFSKETGCTHISELALATFDFIIARLYGPNSQDFTQAEKEKRVCEMAHFLCQNNSCTIFNQKNKPHFDSAGRYKGQEYDY